ncbi:MAG: hypothetical protein IT439_06115 [Phycisphaerales bacterium]|nr:hypothetical protein [Phycisphaerales bacterium]
MRDPSEGWSWVTGESWSFTAWGVGEPNDALGAADETFLHFDNVLDTPIPGRMWNDYQNAGGTPVTAFIVEFNTPAPGPLLISTILIGGSVFCRRHQRRE